MRSDEPDFDVEFKNRDQLKEEVIKLRKAIRKHRDSSGHDLCWYHPEMWNLLPDEPTNNINIPNTCEFLENCAKYRKSLDKPDTNL